MPQPVKKTQNNLKGAGPGRPKGAANKTTALLKDAILKAAAGAGKGDMAAYLQIQAITNPGPFMALLGKVLPLQIAGPDGPDGKPQAIQISIVDPKR